MLELASVRIVYTDDCLNCCVRFLNRITVQRFVTHTCSDNTKLLPSLASSLHCKTLTHGISCYLYPRVIKVPVSKLFPTILESHLRCWCWCTYNACGLKPELTGNRVGLSGCQRHSSLPPKHPHPHPTTNLPPPHPITYVQDTLIP